MLRIMVLTFLIFVVSILSAQDSQNKTSFSGVYRGKPLFVQNPYLSTGKAYCINQITINNEPVEINYDVSALILDFEGVNMYSPVSIHIEYSDSTCVPVLLNPEAIHYHSVFSFEELLITDSSVYWNTKGESDEGQYEVEVFDLGYWETAELRNSNGSYGGSEYTYFPMFEEGTNKYRIKYSSSDFTLYSDEIEHVFYPEPVAFKRNGNILILSRSCAYVVTDDENYEVVTGTGKEIDIAGLKSGEYYIVFNDEQAELFRKNDRIKVIRKMKSNN
ncbi:MAG: hypothetical protein GY816_14650 [Cytophagales bacterium]|nr:hypothetical protein [Cytophagales bacterium]